MTIIASRNRKTISREVDLHNQRTGKTLVMVTVWSHEHAPNGVSIELTSVAGVDLQFNMTNADAHRLADALMRAADGIE